MPEVARTEITIRAATVLKVLAVAAAAALLWALRDVVALLVVAIVLAILVSPVADFCERYRIPRAFGIAVVYIVVLGVLGALFTLLATPIITEARALASALPAAWERLVSFVDVLRTFSVEHGISDQLRRLAGSLEENVAAGVFGALSGFFGGALSFILLLVLTFYLSTYAPAVRRTIVACTPAAWQPFTIGIIPRIERKLGAWLRGLLILGVIMGILDFIGLTILRVDYALLLAIIAGVAEVVPYVGAIVATILAVLLTLMQSPVQAVFVFLLFVLVQQLENHLLVPKIMQRAVGVHPVVSLIAILVGVEIGGIPGALLAIPLVAAASVFVEEYGRERRQHAAAR